jgi:hypothetical protein
MVMDALLAGVVCGALGLVAASFAKSAMGDAIRLWRQEGRIGIVWRGLWLVCTVAATTFFLSASATALDRMLRGHEVAQVVTRKVTDWSLLVGAASFAGCLLLVRYMPARGPVGGADAGHSSGKK